MMPNGAGAGHIPQSDPSVAGPSSSASNSHAVGGPSKVRRTSTSMNLNVSANGPDSGKRPVVKFEQEEGGRDEESGRPLFDYPLPTAEQLDDELPPLRRDGDIGLGLLLDRVVGKGYKDLRVLVGETLPPLPPRDRPVPIIKYAKSTRQTVLKYLAVLRWKNAVDTVEYEGESSGTGLAAPDAASGSGMGVHGNGNGNGAVHSVAASPEDMLTPAPGQLANGGAHGHGHGHGNGESKGKSRAVESGADPGAVQTSGRRVAKGRILDVRRIEEFMKHQNAQHQAAVGHLVHVSMLIETLRVRNPDLLTAISLLQTGTYSRLPTSLTDPFDTKPPLTNGDITRSLHRLNGFIRYRLRCEDYVPPEMRLLEVKDGRAYFAGGVPRTASSRAGGTAAGVKRRRLSQVSAVKEQLDTVVGVQQNLGEEAQKDRGAAQWRAEVTWVNFDNYAQAPRWWLTGVEWWWRERLLRTGGQGGDRSDRNGAPEGAEEGTRRARGKAHARKRLRGMERQRVLDYANQVILAPQPVEDEGKEGIAGAGSAEVARRAVEGSVAGTPAGAPPSSKGAAAATPAVATESGRKEDDPDGKTVDAPLVRLHNFIQHLSLTYQLEILSGQAMQLARGRWRGNLSVNMDREKRQLELRYWPRARPVPPTIPGRRPVPAPGGLSGNAQNKTPLIGGVLTVSVIEDAGDSVGDEDQRGLGMLDELRTDGMKPRDSVLRQSLHVRWEVGEGGEGGGWKSGMSLDHLGGLELDPEALSIESVLLSATSRHAAHLTRANCAPLLSLPRINVFPDRPPLLVKDEPSKVEEANMQAEGNAPERPVTLRIPLPVRSLSSTSIPRARGAAPSASQGAEGPALLVKVSSMTGLIEITDTGAGSSFTSDLSAPAGAKLDAAALFASNASASYGTGTQDRAKRAAQASQSVNDGRTRLGDDLGRLVVAIITDNIENQLRQLGYPFSRKLAMRSQDMHANDVHPATSILVPLPTIAPVPNPLGMVGFAGSTSTASASITSRLPSFTTHYFLVRTTTHGLAFELIRLARVPLDGGIGFKLIIADRMPVDLGLIRTRRKGGVMRSAGADEATQQGSRSSFEVENVDLRDLYIYCNAMVAQSILEQQLKDRSIPYMLQLPAMDGPGSPGSRAAIAGMIPVVVINVCDLLTDPRAAEVARSKVFMQLKGWWKGGKCTADTIVRLLHPPTAANGSGVKDGANGSTTGDSTNPEVKTPKTPRTPATPGAMAMTKSSRAAREEGITFDHGSSVVTFHADDLARCVPLFLEQWERLSKVIIIAGEVSKLARSPSFRDLRMLSFDLRSAIFAYAPQHYCSITYNPAVDAYVSSFSRTATFASSGTPAAGQGAATAATPCGSGLTPTANGHVHGCAQNFSTLSGMQAFTPLSAAVPLANGSGGGGGALQPQQQGLTPAATTPGTFNAASPGEGAPVNPHEPLAGLLSWRLNELVARRKNVAANFIRILCATLPLLSTIEDLQQAPNAASAETPRLAESPSVRIAQAQVQAKVQAQPQGQGPSSVQLVIRSIEEYRLIWDVEGERRHALDVRYLAPRHDAVVFSDAATPRSAMPMLPGDEGGGEDPSCGGLSPVPGWKEGAVQRIWTALRDAASAPHPEPAENGEEAGAEEGAVKSKDANGTGAASEPLVPGPRPASARSTSKSASARLPPMCMDAGASLLVPIDMLESALRRVVREVEAAIATDPGSVTAGAGEKGGLGAHAVSADGVSK